MMEDVFGVIGPVLSSRGAVEEEGEEFRTPALDIVRYYRRPVRLHWLPWLGRAWGVTAVVRQPMDVGIKVGGGYPTLLDRLARAVHSRFPPGRDRRWGPPGPTANRPTPHPIPPP